MKWKYCLPDTAKSTVIIGMILAAQCCLSKHKKYLRQVSNETSIFAITILADWTLAGSVNWIKQFLQLTKHHYWRLKQSHMTTDYLPLRVCGKFRYQPIIWHLKTKQKLQQNKLQHALKWSISTDKLSCRKTVDMIGIYEPLTKPASVGANH